MTERVRPRTLKGFRDFLPSAAIAREQLLDTAKAVYRSYGFVPIETPALEYTEILLGKGSDESDKQMYRFEDQGGRDVAMRFDLTVPLARFVAQHAGTIGMPFKRYHSGPVWRGENTQRGRYREFLQCDFDTIGTESLVADIETGLVIHDLFLAIGFDRFTIRLNNRKVLNGILEAAGLADRSISILRILDKMPKIGTEATREELLGASVASEAASTLVSLHGLEVPGVFGDLGPMVEGSDLGKAGVDDLQAVYEGMLAGGVAPERVAVDVSIARGLDYYTATVFETYLDDLPEIGSCCSGGRYDDLASTYTKERLPGVGASLGVDRVLAAMEDLGMVAAVATTAPILLTQFSAAHLDGLLALATELRSVGLDVELYPEARKLGQQLKYGDRRGHRLAIIVGDAEWEAGTATVKDLATGASVEVARDALAAKCKALLE